MSAGAFRYFRTGPAFAGLVHVFLQQLVLEACFLLETPAFAHVDSETCTLHSPAQTSGYSIMKVVDHDDVDDDYDDDDDDEYEYESEN